MEFKEHKAIIIAETKLDRDGVGDFLEHMEAPEWESTSNIDAEVLTEIAGKICYKSFNTKTNPNLTRVRNNNQEYIKSLLESNHGSVFEHATVTFALLNVSRVLTHELVRHRAGTAFSQESGRYCRIENLSMYKPKTNDLILGKLYECADSVDEAYKKLYKYINPIISRSDIKTKKILTSILRRLSPEGSLTNIIVTANHRAWRHICKLRTSGGAEEEIKIVFKDIFNKLRVRYPNIYQDMGGNNDE